MNDKNMYTHLKLLTIKFKDFAHQQVNLKQNSEILSL